MRQILQLISSRAMDYPPPELSLGYVQSTMQPAHPIKILIIEDDAATAAVFRDALEIAGFSCVIRQSMAGAAHYLSGLKRDDSDDLPLVILLDFGLHDSYSYATVDRIPILKEYGAVIVTTGEGDPILERIAIEKGAKKYYAKPIKDLNAFLQDVEETARCEALNRQLTRHSEQAAGFAKEIKERYLTNGTINGK